jgi:hypothetical protein
MTESASPLAGQLRSSNGICLLLHQILLQQSQCFHRAPRLLLLLMMKILYHDWLDAMPSAEIAFYSKTGLSMMLLLLQHSSVNEGGKPTIKWRQIDAALNVIFHHMLWFSFVERNFLE